jgi:Leucine-rich repeat (LRR) protein
LPNEIGNLKNLEELYLNENQFEIFPDAISQCVALKDLSMSRNQLQSIPNEIGHLHGLEQLNLEHNRLTTTHGVARLGNLKGLNLCHNLLQTDAIQAVGHLAKLEVLGLGGNPIQELPKAVKQLANLRKIIVPTRPLITVDAIASRNLSWTPSIHRNYSIAIKRVLKFLFLVSQSSQDRFSSILQKLPKDILFAIFSNFSVVSHTRVEIMN